MKMFNFFKREEFLEEVQLVINDIKNNPDEWEVRINAVEAINKKKNIRVYIYKVISGIGPADGKAFPKLPVNKREENALYKIIRQLNEARMKEEDEYNQTRQAIRERLQ